jgi:hypothetical protein
MPAFSDHDNFTGGRTPDPAASIDVELTDRDRCHVHIVSHRRTFSETRASPYGETKSLGGFRVDDQVVKTIGISLVNCFALRVAGGPIVTMTSGFPRTSSLRQWSLDSQRRRDERRRDTQDEVTSSDHSSTLTVE